MDNNLFDTIYEDGINTPANNQNLYFRVGVIVKVYDENVLDNTNEREGYMSVAIKWLDGVGGYGYMNSGFAKLSIHYPHISNGSGEVNVPNKWDFVICGFRQGGYASIVGYIDKRIALQALGLDKIEELPGFFMRKLVEGECYKKSKQGAETYYDRKGGLHFLIRDQGTTHPVKVFQETFETVDDNPILEMTMGATYGLKQEGNEMPGKEYSQVQQYDFDNEIKLSSGASTRYSLRDLKTGTQILIGTDGNIEVNTAKDLKINVSGKTELTNTGDIDITSEGSVNINGEPTINLNGESLSVAIAERVSEKFDGHYHMAPQASSGTLPTGVPTTLMGTTIASTKVKVGG